MARKEKIPAEVEFKAKGLKALRSQWLDFAGDLAEPMILLAAGASKAQALWGGLKGIFLTRVLGPMGMVAGASAALLAVTGKLIGKWKEWGLVGAASLSRMTLEFRPLLGSLEMARKRVKELYDFTAKTPFRLQEVARGNKILETLTKGALATRSGMELVGDASAVANTKFDETSRTVGRLYDGLMSGRPVGEAAMRMQEMGLISGKTRNSLESMQKAGVSGAEVWAVVENELKKFKGAAHDLSQELEGLQSTQEDVKAQAEAGFGKGFLDGEKATIKATTAAWEKMTPVLEYLGEQVGTVSNWMAKGKARMLEMLTSVPGLTNGIKLLANTFIVLTSAVLLASGAALTRFLIGVISVTAASKKQVVAMGRDTAVKGVNTVVTRKLTIAQAQLAGAYGAVRKGAFLTAASHLRTAAAATLSAARTNGLATATMILRGGLRLTGLAIRFVIVQLRAMAVALLTNPLFLFASVLIGVGAALLHFSNQAKKAAAALRDYQKASESVVDSLEAQRRSLETVADLRKHEADVVRRLGEAYREEEKFRRRGKNAMLEAARKKIRALRDELKATENVTRASLRMSAAEKKREERGYREGVDVKRLKKDAELEDAGADERVRILEERAKQAEQKRQKALDDLVAEERTKQAIDSGGLKNALNRDALDRKREELARTEEQLEAQIKTDRSAALWGQNDNRVQDNLRENTIPGLRKELAEMEAAFGAGSAVETGLKSDSEIARLEARLALYDKLAKAREDLLQADKALRDLNEEAEEKDRRRKTADHDQAVANLKALEKLRGKHGGFANERKVEEAKLKLSRLRENRSDDASDKKVYEAQRALEKARRDRENEIARIRIDTESGVAALRFRGMEAEEKALRFAREKLELARTQKKLGEAEYQSQQKLLNARQQALHRKAREAGESMVSRLMESRLRRLSEDAVRSGDQDRAKKLRQQADEVHDRQRKRELEKEAGEITSDPAQVKRYVDAVMAEEQAARASQRKRDEQEKQDTRARALAEGDGGLSVELLRRQGKTREANRLEEQRQRKLDDIRRGELQRKYREDGFSAEEADRLTNRDIKIGQAERMFDQLRAEAGGAHVVASSLAQIGGGGGVSGQDPNTRLLEQMRELLREIRDQEKEDVTAIF